LRRCVFEDGAADVEQASGPLVARLPHHLSARSGRAGAFIQVDIPTLTPGQEGEELNEWLVAFLLGWVHRFPTSRIVGLFHNQTGDDMPRDLLDGCGRVLVANADATFDLARALSPQDLRKYFLPCTSDTYDRVRASLELSEADMQRSFHRIEEGYVGRAQDSSDYLNRCSELLLEDTVEAPEIKVEA
jgi:hypothetical protein